MVVLPEFQTNANEVDKKRETYKKRARQIASEEERELVADQSSCPSSISAWVRRDSICSIYSILATAPEISSISGPNKTKVFKVLIYPPECAHMYVWCFVQYAVPGTMLLSSIFVLHLLVSSTVDILIKVHGDLNSVFSSRTHADVDPLTPIQLTSEILTP